MGKSSKWRLYNDGCLFVFNKMISAIKLLRYKRNKTLWNVLLLKSNQLVNSKSTSC